LTGEEGGGLAAMFTLMNHARVDVALQGVAHAARAHDIAASYASGRAQGRRPDGAPAMLSDHADVRQMLDEQRAPAVGSRAMCHLALVVLEGPDQLPLADFLTPICEMFATEAGIRAAGVGIQLLGADAEPVLSCLAGWENERDKTMANWDNNARTGTKCSGAA
jgi:alkylation response protein AidB-like acyl-CoA dehydrogenase